MNEGEGFFTASKDVKFSFPQIVLKQVNRINDLISEDVERTKISINKLGLVEEHNLKLEAIKSIEVLDKLLLPHYNKLMIDNKKEIEKRFDEIDKGFDKDFKEWFDQTKIPFKQRDKLSLFLKYEIRNKDTPLYTIFIDKLLDIQEDLFTNLLQLLFDIDYLKGSKYEET